MALFTKQKIFLTKNSWTYMWTNSVKQSKWYQDKMILHQQHDNWKINTTEAKTALKILGLTSATTKHCNKKFC